VTAPQTLIITVEDFVKRKSISITASERIPPEADIIEAVKPLVRRTNADLRTVIVAADGKSIFMKANITTIPASPGLAPSGSGKGTMLSIYESVQASARRIPESAIRYVFFTL
jgi:hypothetical protein